MNKNSYPIQLGYTNKLGNFHELVITNDSKYMLQVKYDREKQAGGIILKFRTYDLCSRDPI